MIKITGLLYKENNESIEDFLRRDVTEEEIESFGEAMWSWVPFDEVYLYDLDEHIYKKRKVYFHISPLSLTRIKAQTKDRGTTPAAFFTMDIKTCVDFFRYKFKNDTAFLHRCVNNRPIDLFNPAADSDVDSLHFDSQNRERFLKLLRPEKYRNKNLRYWRILEEDIVMRTIYDRTKCDGMALDFYKYGTTSWNDRTEGFCLFNRGISAITLMDVTRIDNIQNLTADPQKLIFQMPGSPELLS